MLARVRGGRSCGPITSVSISCKRVAVEWLSCSRQLCVSVKMNCKLHNTSVSRLVQHACALSLQPELQRGKCMAIQASLAVQSYVCFHAGLASCSRLMWDLGLCIFVPKTLSWYG